MTVQDLDNRLKNNGKLLLVDVREQYEIDICQLKPHIHIPMSSFTQEYEKLPRNEILVIYCHHGIRSKLAVNFLKQQGYNEVFNLEGGIHQWALKIDTSMPQY